MIISFKKMEQLSKSVICILGYVLLPLGSLGASASNFPSIASLVVNSALKKAKFDFALYFEVSARTRELKFNSKTKCQEHGKS